MIGFVDLVTPRERIEPWLTRCAYCGDQIHRAESHARIVDYCDRECLAQGVERERSAGALDVVLAFGFRGLVTIACLLGFLTFVRIVLSTPAVRP